MPESSPVGVGRRSRRSSACHSWTRPRRSSSKAVDDHGDKIAQGIDKAGAFANEKTGGKHADKIDQATGKARDALDSLDGKNDDIPPSTTTLTLLTGT